MMSEKECIKWVEDNMPFAITPSKKAKTKLIYPFVSSHAEQQVIKHLGKELHKLLTGGDK
jgi:hypothetical protein